MKGKLYGETIQLIAYISAYNSRIFVLVGASGGKYEWDGEKITVVHICSQQIEFYINMT